MMTLPKVFKSVFTLSRLTYHFLRWTVGLLLTYILFSFALFLYMKDSYDATPAQKADVIIVFTGENRRILIGLDFLKQGYAPHMRVSGVDADYNLARMKTRYPNYRRLIQCCVSLDKIAQNTVGNAKETAAWLKKNEMNSVILVTAGYHMPRASLLLKRYGKGLTIMPTPIYFSRYQKWWNSAKGREVIFKEYIKYAATFIGII